MPLTGAGQTNIPVADLLDLASKITGEASTLEGQLNALYNRVIRPSNFQGNAAAKYDEFLGKWKTDQGNMLTNMRGAASILNRLADITQQNNDLAANAMNI